MRMQTKEQHAQSVALGRVEHAEKFAAAKKNKTSDVVQCVEKSDGCRDQNKANHQQRAGPVYIAQQPIERDSEANENHLPDKITEDRKPEKRFVSKNVACSRGRVPPHDELIGNINETEGRGKY